MLYIQTPTHLHISRPAEVPLHQFSPGDARLCRNSRFYDPRPVYDLHFIISIDIGLYLGNGVLRHYL